MVEEISELGNTTKSRCLGVRVEGQANGKEPWTVQVVRGFCHAFTPLDNRGVIGASFRAEEFSEIVGYYNMADYTF